MKKELSPLDILKAFLLEKHLEISSIFNKSFENRISIDTQNEKIVFRSLDSENPIYEFGENKEWLEGNYWISNINENRKVYIFSSPSEALYFSSIFKKEDIIYFAIKNFDIENLKNSVEYLKSKIQNPEITICLNNSNTSMKTDLLLFMLITKSFFMFNDQKLRFSFYKKGHDEIIVNEVRHFFFRIKENINLKELREDYFKTDIITINENQEQITINFLDESQLKKYKRKIILSLPGLEFIKDVNLLKPPMTLKSSILNWETVKLRSNE
ncbi:hypothetical protein [Elizabethkingia ursingii]